MNNPFFLSRSPWPPNLYREGDDDIEEEISEDEKHHKYDEKVDDSRAAFGSIQIFTAVFAPSAPMAPLHSTFWAYHDYILFLSVFF